MTAAALPKILIVDDDDDLRRIFVRYLSAEGFEVHDANRVENALGMAGRQKYDLILLDIRMQDTNGSSLIPAFRKDHPELKIIVSSCYAVDLQKEMAAGASDYFDKSNGFKALLSKIHTILPSPEPHDGPC